MTNNFQTIHRSELDDFETSCQQYKLDPNSFQLQEHDITQTPAGNGLHHPHGKITISRNGKSKTYITGNGSKWPAEFDDDLRASIFN